MGAPVRIDRRNLLAMGAGLLAMPVIARAVEPRSGFAVVDWALLETALALGLTPLAAPELRLFHRLAVEPAVPASVADLGLRGSLAFERLALLDPAIVYGSNYSQWAAPQIERIAPLKTFDLFLAGEPPLPKIEAATLALAEDFGIRETGEAVVRGAEERFAALAATLARAGPPPVLLVDVGDANHVRVYGGDSLFGNAIARLGLANAWGGATRYSATAPVGIETLAAYPDAFLAVVGPVPPEARSAIRDGALWQALPQVSAGRFAVLPACNAFGALPAALRLARHLAVALGVEPI